MARGKLRFKERDVARALRAVAKVSVPQRVEIDHDGKIIVILSSQEQEQSGANEWDDAG
jgi:nitrate reductase NapAB chaperone NapD